MMGNVLAKEGSVNHFGRESRLFLTIGTQGVKDVCFTAPYKVLHPFRQRGFWQIMAAKASAGLMAGDCQEVQVVVEDGARGEIISQSFEKIHAMDEGLARRRGVLKVGREAVLLYAPLPVLPFAGSAFESSFTVQLADETSRLFYADTIACGRAARGELFRYRLYASRLRVYQGGQMVYADNLHFAPAESGLAGLTQYEGYTHLGNCLLLNFRLNREDLLAFLQELPVYDKIQGGLTTLAGGGLCLKALSRGSEPLLELQERLKDYVVKLT